MFSAQQDAEPNKLQQSTAKYHPSLHFYYN